MPVRELAELSGVKKSAIDSYLNNRERMPSAETAIRLARTLGVSVEHLFGETEALPEPCTGPGAQERANDRKQKRDEKLAHEAQKLAQHLREFADLLEGYVAIDQSGKM
jgi:transcriptional regulator with XRE-family HTH domain